ncbi:MAG: hypothetical protein ACO3D2_00585 [Holophagaceae bacterium]
MNKLTSFAVAAFMTGALVAQNAPAKQEAAPAAAPVKAEAKKGVKKDTKKGSKKAAAEKKVGN